MNSNIIKLSFNIPNTGTQRKVHFQTSSDAKSRWSDHREQSLLVVGKRFESAIQDGNARKLSLCMAHEINDSQTNGRVWNRNVLRSARALEKAQYFHLWMRKQTIRMFWKIDGTGLPSYATQKRRGQGYYYIQTP